MATNKEDGVVRLFKAPIEEIPDSLVSTPAAEPVTTALVVTNETDLAAMAQKLAASVYKDPFQVLAASLAMAQADPIIDAIKHRNVVVESFKKLSIAIQGITVLAELLNVVYDESPVKADNNFTNWDNDDIAGLIAHIRVGITSSRELMQAEKDRATALAQNVSLLNDKITSLSEAHSVATSGNETILQASKDRVAEVTALLNSFTDVDEFVIAQVDAVTKAAVAYLVEEDNRLGKSTDWELATRYATFEEANDVRVRLIQSKKNKLNPTQRRAFSDSLVVMQAALRPVARGEY